MIRGKAALFYGRWPTYAVIISLFLASMASSSGEPLYADPRNSGELNQLTPLEPSNRPPFYKIPAEIKAISEHVAALQRSLDALPDIQSPMLPDSFGYHSDYLPATDEQLPEEPRWTLDLKAAVEEGPLDLVLIPAQDHRISTPTGYAFPKRFRIVSQAEVRNEISQELHIAPVTVDYHLRNVYNKLQVNSQAGAVGKAIRKGLI